MGNVRPYKPQVRTVVCMGQQRCPVTLKDICQQQSPDSAGGRTRTRVACAAVEVFSKDTVDTGLQQSWPGSMAFFSVSGTVHSPHVLMQCQKQSYGGWITLFGKPYPQTRSILCPGYRPPVGIEQRLLHLCGGALCLCCQYGLQAGYGSRAAILRPRRQGLCLKQGFTLNAGGHWLAACRCLGAGQSSHP